MPSQNRRPADELRYNGLASRPRVEPGAVVLCGVCQARHVLAPDPLRPTPGLLYYHCAAPQAGRAAPGAQTHHLGALAGWLLDGLAPLTPPGDGAPPSAPGTHEHVCSACARTWLHPGPACRPRGMIPRRCGRCQRRLAATLARWAHVRPEDGAAAPARPTGSPGPRRRRGGAALPPIRRTAKTLRSGGTPR